MKHFILTLLTVLACCAGTKAVNRTVTAQDSLGRMQTIVLNDTVIDGETVTDTLSVTTVMGSDDGPDTADRNGWHVGWNQNGWEGGDAPQVIVALAAIIFIFGMPIFIIFIIFYFRYKNRKAKYRLAEQALASGQPLPADFFRNVNLDRDDLRVRGIKNTCLGLGLFLFLWTLTDLLGIGLIGMIIMLNGIGQLLIYYTQPKSSRNVPPELPRDYSSESRQQATSGAPESGQEDERTE